MKELIKELELNKIYFECDVFKKIDLHMKNHPNYSEKIKNGINGYVYKINETWGKNNKCFFIINNDLELIPISYNFGLVKNLQKTESLKAFRTCIEMEVYKFKKTFVKGVTKCEITGSVIGNLSNCHVDHYNYDFRDVVDMFLKKYNKSYTDIYKYVTIVDTKRFFSNKKLVEYFIKFHNENTNLRFTTVSANLKRAKK
jgi:hypothetical protein